MNDVVIVDGVVRRRARPLDGSAIASAATNVRQWDGWWAGLVVNSTRRPHVASLRQRDLAVVAADQHARPVVWLGEFTATPEAAVNRPAAVAEAVLAGTGALWAGTAGETVARAWRVLCRAHTRVLLGRACDLPPIMCRRILGDAPGAVERAVEAWLAGEEGMAVQIVRSAIAERVARSEPGYQRFDPRQERGGPAAVGRGHGEDVTR